MQISFTSTFRVKLNQQGTSPFNKDAIKQLALEHGGSAPSSRQGCVRFSVPKRLDQKVKTLLGRHGFNHYEEVPRHNVPQEQILDALECKGRFSTTHQIKKYSGAQALPIPTVVEATPNPIRPIFEPAKQGSIAVSISDPAAYLSRLPDIIPSVKPSQPSKPVIADEPILQEISDKFGVGLKP